MTDANIERIKEIQIKQKELDNKLTVAHHDVMLKRAKVLLSGKDWKETLEAIMKIDDEHDKLEGNILFEKLKLSIEMDMLLYAD